MKKIVSLLVGISSVILLMSNVAAADETLWQIGVFDTSRSELKGSGLTSTDVWDFNVGDPASEFPGTLYQIPSSNPIYNDRGVNIVNIHFTVEGYYEEVVLTYGRGGDETDYITLDGEFLAEIIGTENSWEGSPHIVPIGDLTPGEHVISIEVIDGGSGDNAHVVDALRLTGTVDTTPPVIVLVEPVNEMTYNGVIPLEATCNEDCDYVNFWWRHEYEEFDPASNRYHYEHEDGTEFSWELDPLHALLADGNYYVMEDGVYYFYAAGKDLAGNWARTPEVKIYLDTTAPLVTIESPEDGEYLDGTVKIYGTIVEDIELSHYNIAVYPGDADFTDPSKRLEQETVYRSDGFVDELIYEWDTTIYDDGEYQIRLAARDKAGNRDLSGDPYAGGDDSQHVIIVYVDNDHDDDGVPDDDDICNGTVADIIPDLKPNHFRYDGSPTFKMGKNKGKGKGPKRSYSIEDTHGCSCKQILDELNEEYGGMNGHRKHGCSIGIMDKWVKMHSDL